MNALIPVGFVNEFMVIYVKNVLDFQVIEVSYTIRLTILFPSK